MSTMQEPLSKSTPVNSVQLIQMQDSDEAIDLGQYVSAIVEYRYIILMLTVIGGLLGICYAIVATPQYTADVLIQVEPNQSAGLPALEDISTLFEGESSIDAEIQLLTSRMVLGKTIQQLGIDIQISPRYFPIFGEAMARRFESQPANKGSVAKSMFGFEEYAWGGEELVLDILNLPASLESLPLELKVLGDGSYVFLADGVQLLEGKAGQLAQSRPLNTPTFQIEDLVQIHVSTLKARPGTIFNVQKTPLPKAIAVINDGLRVKEVGKSSGMLSLILMHPNQDKVASYVNTIADVYVSQNVQRSSAEAQLSLQFLEAQLPPLKEQLDAAENAYNLYRVEHGSIDLQTETQSVLREMSEVGASLLVLEQQRKELRKRYKPAHPAIKALDGKIAVLKSEETRLEASSDELPSVQKEVLRLAREVEMNTILYSKLLNTAQELKVAKAGTVGNVRVIDNAYRPSEPVKPNKKLVVLLATGIAFVLGLIFAIVLRIVRGGINDPDEIEKQLGVPVYASVMHSAEQALLNKAVGQNRARPIGILTKLYPDSLTVESLRSLRTSLLFTLKEAPNNIVMIAGAAPKIGKTFSAINLAAVMAESGKQVLVIDADLRRGSLHQYLGVSRKNGLSELIMNGNIEPLKQLYSTEAENLYALTTGELPASPAELLLHSGFQKLLDIYASAFDYVIIDAPPILAVTDAAIIGRSVGTTLMVVKANFHRIRELDQANKQFSQAGITIKGVIFNDVRAEYGRYGSGKYVYRYEYKNG